MKNRLLLCVLLISLTGPISALAGWTEYTSPNFQLYTDASEATAEAWVNSLEDYAALVRKFGVSHAPQNINVILHSDYALYQKIKPNKHAVAHIDRIEGESYLMIGREVRPIDMAIKKQIIFTIYSNYYLARSAEKHPSWFARGLSKIISSAQFHENKAIIGAPLDVLTLMPIETLMFDDNARRNPYYQLNVTAYVHYLLFGSAQGYPNHLEQLTNYFASESVKTPETFEQALGQSIASLEESYHKYLQQPGLKAVSMSLNSSPSLSSKRALSKDEISGLMVRILIAHNEYGYAKKYAKKISRDSSEYLSIAKRFEQYEAAQHALKEAEKSLKKTPDNIELLKLAATQYWENAKTTSDVKEVWALAQKAIGYAERALAINPNDKNMHIVLRFSYHRLGNHEKTFEHIKALHRMDPDDAGLNSVMGGRYAREKNYTAARTYLKRACALDVSMCELMQKRLGEIDRLERVEQESL